MMPFSGDAISADGMGTGTHRSSSGHSWAKSETRRPAASGRILGLQASGGPVKNGVS